MRRLAPLLMLAALAGCDRRPDDVPVVVSAIGFGVPRLPMRPGDALPLPAALFTASTAQGLVRFDASGQVEPGLAERWIVIDEGRSYIFRLADAEWANGDRVTAREVVAGLKRAIANPRNPLRPHLSAIDEVVEMTPLVIEVRLSRPRPDLLPLFAQPELVIPGPRGGGSGRWGSGAIGGGIEIDSATPDQLAPFAAEALYGERNGVDARAAATLARGPGFATLSAGYARGDGFAPIVEESRGPVDRAAPYE
ncbi:MAG TPA: ABC transporter substrate-binding protein, partial [Sphingomonas bacterium]|nr:ABC transporter substrate-binding protein [Sphingomonas bacterium]